jgi:hypothetical protein
MTIDPAGPRAPEPPPRGRILLELVALPDDVPADVRVRRAVKLLLRAFRLRAVELREEETRDPELEQNREGT